MFDINVIRLKKSHYKRSYNFYLLSNSIYKKMIKTEIINKK